MRGMEELVDTGKVRFIGVSNFSVPDPMNAQAVPAKQRIVANQVRYSLVESTISPSSVPPDEPAHYPPTPGALQLSVSAFLECMMAIPTGYIATPCIVSTTVLDHGLLDCVLITETVFENSLVT
jgi:hypothetical protein